MCTAGFYIVWGCLVWVPCIYTSPALYLVKNPIELHFPTAFAITLSGLICIYINYECDYQRQLFRHTEGKAKIWGQVPSKIVAHYTTETGDQKQSILLTSGWWGVARHFHYVPEILASFFWSLPALFYNFPPYFYTVYLTLLLLDRATRDDQRCRAKYQKYWEQYCRKVRYAIVPGVY
jgi:7-dehydrocholesterol reductase